MNIRPSNLAIAAGIETTKADALLGVLKERGREFASDSETWAEFKLKLDAIKGQVTAIESVHKEMWSAIKDRNPDAFAALSEEFERNAFNLAGEWVRLSVMAKIALDDPELPEENEEETSAEYVMGGEETLSASEMREMPARLR